MMRFSRFALPVLVASGCGEPSREVRVRRAEYDASLAAVAALPPCPPAPSPDPAWRREEHAGAFSLALPPDFRVVDTQGIDSHFRSYSAPGRRMSLDYGRFSDSLNEPGQAHRGHSACRALIGGWLARVVTGRTPRGGYFAAAAWRAPSGRAGRFPSDLTVWSESDTPAGQREGLAVLHGVRFGM